MTAPTRSPAVSLPAAIRSYWGSLTGAQFKLFVLLADLCTPSNQWVEISIGGFCQVLEIRRETAINGLRALVACGLIERTARAARTRHLYRITPDLPERNPKQITGRMRSEKTGPVSGPQPVRFSDHSTGPVFVPLGIQTEDFSGRIYKEKGIPTRDNTAAAKNGHAKQQQQPAKSTAEKTLSPARDLPATFAAVTQHYPEADEKFFRQLWALSLEAFQSVPDDFRVAGADALLDDHLAHAVEICRKPHQRGAGMYLKTVPACIAAWVRGAQK